MAIIYGLTEVCAGSPGPNFIIHILKCIGNYLLYGLLSTGLAHPKQPYQSQKYSRCTPSNYCGVQLVSRRVTVYFFCCFVSTFNLHLLTLWRFSPLNSWQIPRAKTCLATHFRIRYVAPALRSNHGLSYDDEDFLEEPIWLTLKKEAFGYLTYNYVS